ncbi:PREDICTED: uncharacterized protein LOC106747653 [Dinoponera quadriceps]|uniref:Uncharacterized protein LOC106747653 n=1 Tax=Dinoponera quadriceps TaxID=609295 RepID=A0A6P3XSL2_DINQU|nr:PREDICTED: uncharacterized protein LOC106747653 [Dinoponera quadriceps]
MSNLHMQVLEPRVSHVKKYYNHFFNPNICHVCKSVNMDNSISCEKCRLVFYCTKEHKNLHKSHHMDICRIIAHVSQVDQNRRRFSNRQEWIQSRKELLELIKHNLRRPLETYELQMILWSKSCIACHQQAELHTCQKCFSANYCDDHATAFGVKHDERKCEHLTILFDIYTKTMTVNKNKIKYEFFEHITEQNSCDDMYKFCTQFILMQRGNVNLIAQDYVKSDYLSGPLTVYSGLKRINVLSILQGNSVVIHIIAANSVDRNGLEAWEILLHLLPDVQELVIIMIGPELSYDMKTCQLCEQCKRKKTFDFFSIPMLYHNYVKMFEGKRDPDVIVGFHVELNEGNTWSESLRAIQTRFRPLILGSSCKREAHKDINKIKNVIGTSINPIFNGCNHFAGLVPHMNLETGDIYFRNEHLIIYDKLY